MKPYLRMSLIGLVFVWVCPAYSQSAWPNEPSGSAVFYDCTFNNTICGMQNYYNTAAFAADAAAPSAPTVFDTYRGANSTNGNGQWGLDLPNVREIYVGFWWSTNSAFQGTHVNSNKMISIGAPGHNNLLSWMGGQDQPKQLARVTQQTDGSQNFTVLDIQRLINAALGIEAP